MTINIAAFGTDVVYTASDRCISVNGQPAESFNKALVFATPTLRIAMSYTGLATTDDSTIPKWMPMDLWVADQFPAEPESFGIGLADFAHILAQRASEFFRRLPKGWQSIPTIFTFVGWERQNGRAVMTGTRVHNCLDETGQHLGATSKFEVNRISPKRNLWTAGADRRIHRNDRRRLERLLRNTNKATEIQDGIGRLIQKVARNEPNLVSSDFTLVSLPMTGDSSAYWFSADSTVGFGPSMVMRDPKTGAGYTLGHPEVTFGTELPKPHIFKKLT